jgi:hypothetical protein
MGASALSKPPRIELHLRSRKIIADGPEAIDAVRWPLRILIVAIALGVIGWSICLLAAAGFLRSLI